MLGTHTGFGKIGRMTFSHLALTAAVQPDTVSPHDKEALDLLYRHWEEVRLPNLIRGAARSRDLAEVHKGIARDSIAAARTARQQRDEPAYLKHLGDARDAHDKARECYRFARQCERRAQAIILAGGCSPLEN
jgi:hypothetical protein